MGALLREDRNAPVTVFESQDPEQTRAFVARIFCAHRFDAGVGGGGFGVRICHLSAGKLSFNSFAYASDVCVEPGLMHDFYLVQLVLQGAEMLHYGCQDYELRPGVISVIGPDVPVSKSSPAGTRKLLVKIERHLLEKVCMQHLAHHLREPLRFQVAMRADRGDGASLLSTIGFLHDQLNEPTSVFKSPLMVANLEQTLATSLLVSQPSNYYEELTSAAPSVAPGFVRRVEEYIDAHADQPITAADLARHAGVSTRSLFVGFRKYRNTTPISHLRFVRMSRAHADIVGDAPGRRTVTEIAMHWGFGHLGRFTSEYKRRFGESPSATLRRFPREQ